jgi:hypothetical protein
VRIDARRLGAYRQDIALNRDHHSDGVNVMTPGNQHPTCSHCGCRIRVSELVWRELGSGAIRGAYASDLDGRRREGRGLWHLGCLPLGRHGDLTPDRSLDTRRHGSQPRAATAPLRHAFGRRPA